jgi:tetratricopeptide (TPR) repeat protein
MRIPCPAVLVSFLALIALPVSAQVTPQTLAKLEARRQSKPNDAKALRDLGIALFKLKRYSEARTVLTEGSRLNPKDGVTALYLGMSAEEMNDLPAASQAYTTYLATGKTRAAKDAVSQRLALLTQRQLKAQAAAAVAQEQRLAGEPGNSMTIAVLPLSVSGPGGTPYEPLGRGLAELMIADFAKVGGVTLLERARIQAMLDEIALGRSNQIDRPTAARSGRLLQAGRLVTGSLVVPNAANIQISTSIVTITSPNTPMNGGAAGGSLNAIFDYEKEVVLETIDSMKVPITPAVRAAIRGNRPTTNLQAFLAYSRGLVASDAGRLDEAATFFDNARALDPNFAAAAQQAANARTASAGQGVTTARIEATLRGSSEGQIVTAAETGATSTSGVDALGATLQNVLADVNPSTADAIGRVSVAPASRDPQSSATQTDGSVSTRTGTVTIIIKRP